MSRTILAPRKRARHLPVVRQRHPLPNGAAPKVLLCRDCPAVHNGRHAAHPAAAESMHIPDRLKPDPTRPVRPPEPRWPSLVAMLSVGSVNLALPSALSPGPDWLVLVLVALLIGPAILMHRLGRYKDAQVQIGRASGR